MTPENPAKTGAQREREKRLKAKVYDAAYENASNNIKNRINISCFFSSLFFRETQNHKHKMKT